MAKRIRPNTTGSSNAAAPGRGSSAVVPKKPSSASAPASQYLLPTVKNATTNNTLYPIDAKAGTTVTCPSAIPAGTQITLNVAIKGQEADPVFTAITQGTGAPNVEVDVPAWAIGYCIGLTVIIWYKTPSGESLRLELFVEVIKPVDMPVPVFTDLSSVDGSWWLDMANFPGDAVVKLCKLPFIAAGQRLWIEAVGNEHLAQPRFFWILEDHVVTEEEARSGYCFLLGILREWLAENDDWSSVTVGAGITYSGAAGTAPEDPRISRLPRNAQLSRRATANLRVREAELKLLEPHIQEATYVEGKGYLISPANTVNGAHVVVAYNGIKPGDKVCVKFAGTPGPGTPVLACQVVQQGETSLVFRVPASAISANFGKLIKVSYTVLRGSVWPSSELLARVLEPTGLGGIDVDEKTGGQICLNNFPGDATVRVPIWDYIDLGQTGWLGIKGELEDGSPFHWSILTAETVKPEWVTGGVSAVLSRDELEKLADCQVFQIYFAVSFTGSNRLEDAIQFLPLSLEMVQKDLVLVEPSVREAVGNLLTVWNGRDGVTVRVEYDGMSAHHIITLCWEQAGVCLELTPQAGDPIAGYVDFIVPREAVIHGIGKKVPIRFSVASRCKQQTSPSLELEISAPVRVPTPVVPEATPPGVQNGILDLAAFVGDAWILVENWWFSLLGQRVWLKCTGIGKDGNTRVFYPVNGQLLTQDEVMHGLKVPMSRADLALLMHETPLDITCTVTADGGEPESKGVVFKVLNLILRQPLVCEQELFETLLLGVYAAPHRWHTPLMTIDFVSGGGLAGISRYHSNGFGSGHHYTVCDQADLQTPAQLHRLTFTHATESVKFGCLSLQRPATFTFYDLAGGVIKVINEPGDKPGGFWVECIAPAGVSIGVLTVNVMDWAFLDQFMICYRL
ncbi:hypothetical protein [Pseudomonas cedrina]|uniref:hypothetical protein n=1 Tax=Pseudomonas cedrina TaxID=651740 RepID=UPI00278752BD|nr:hypothetical protein [Pseudomonas cedrina]MDQ0653233.1 hypothetical protein [Pseudomonas cedrina]